MMEMGPGLIGGSNETRDSVSYTALDTVRHSRPRVLLPRWLTTDAAFVLRESLSALRVSNAGCTQLGGMVGWGKPSMIFSAKDMVGAEEYCPLNFV